MSVYNVVKQEISAPYRIPDPKWHFLYKNNIQ